MDVRDLNILDWVLWDTTPCQVTAIGCDYIETTKCGITLAESHLLNPIPVTPEILEKNGWSKDLYDNESYDNDDFEQLSLWEGADGNAWWWHVGIELVVPLNFVHELQHVFRLCGIDKEIVI